MKMLILSQALVLLNLLLLCICTPHRGVPLIRQDLYDPNKNFTCFDGSISIPFSFVNDDYCDCIDGSDEPGTSACPNGNFFCENKGYISEYIPSSRVNDGYCDCCDASDEYLSNKCGDICNILGLEARREAERLEEMLYQGSQLRMQMIAAGKQLVQEKQDKLIALENEKVEAAKIRDEKESLKKIAEELESSAIDAFTAKEEELMAIKTQEEKEQDKKEADSIFLTYDSNKDGRLQREEIRSRPIFDQNKDSVVSDDEVKFFFDVYEEVPQADFYDVIWPRLKPVFLLERVKFIPPPKRDELEENQGNEDNIEPSTNEKKDTDESDENLDEVEEELEDEDVGDVGNEDNHADNGQPKYDEHTVKIVEEANQARLEYDAALRALQDIEREISQHKESLAKDYGPEDEFAPLDGQCFSLVDRDYIYKICPFDQVIQAGKSGGSETRLGIWAGWVDQDYNTMFYDKGQTCWNGPTRSAKVNVSCGLENEVLNAHEPNKCEYVLEFRTPAACRLQNNNKESHDEL